MHLARRDFLKRGASLLGLGALTPNLLASELLEDLRRGDTLEGLLSGGTGVRLPFVMRGARDSSRISLTYDDGPTPGVTDVILDTLRQSRARATFFVIGQRVKSYPSLARRILREGHQIANHTYTHPDLAKMSDSAVRSELVRGQKTIEDVCGVSPRYFRPPYGSFRSRQGAIARAMGLQVIMWSVDPQDWRRPGAGVIASRITGRSSGGDIVLCHDMHKQTAVASKSFIPTLASRYRMVQLGDLLRS